MKKKIINPEIIDRLYPNLRFSSKNFYQLKKYILKISLEYNLKKNKNYFFKGLGNILFPYNNLGKVESYNQIFNANEFVVFYLYKVLKKINKRKFAADFGANLGLHAIILRKYGYEVDAYEPDPNTFKKLKENIKLNNLDKIKIKNFAVFDKSGKINFTRVNDNLTGSHIENLKKSYGRLNTIKIKVLNIKDIIKKYDLIKLDVESAEAKILCSLNKKDFLDKDFIVEIGNIENAEKIFKFLKKNKLSCYSQKNNFKQIKKFIQFPYSHHEGALLISQNYNFK